MPAGRPRSDRQLPHCREVGMSCTECVSNSARGLAAIADSLGPQMAQQLFTAMYPEPACMAMSRTFIQILRTCRAEARRAPETEFLAPALHETPLYQVAAA
jgi:hypothetical protein